MTRILVLEDNDDSYKIMSSILGNDYSLTRAKSIIDAKSIYNSSYDLLILDVGLPDGDGYEYCHWIRSNQDSDTPIIFVSARSSTESCIAGFTSGGDDYIYKPYHPSEFLVRVKSKLKAHAKKLEKSLVLEADGVKIDLATQKAEMESQSGYESLSLTPIEFKILQTFLQQPGVAIKRDDILDKVWGKEIFVYPRSVDTHVSKLRKKLGKKGQAIVSVHGRGYRWDIHQNRESDLEKKVSFNSF